MHRNHAARGSSHLAPRKPRPDVDLVHLEEDLALAAGPAAGCAVGAERLVRLDIVARLRHGARAEVAHRVRVRQDEDVAKGHLIVRAPVRAPDEEIAISLPGSVLASGQRTQVLPAFTIGATTTSLDLTRSKLSMSQSALLAGVLRANTTLRSLDVRSECVGPMGKGRWASRTKGRSGSELRLSGLVWVGVVEIYHSGYGLANLEAPVLKDW